MTLHSSNVFRFCPGFILARGPMNLKILYSHRGRSRSTWVVSDGNKVTTVKAVLRDINPRVGYYSYQVLLDGVPSYVVSVPSPEGLQKKVFEALRGNQW